MVIKHDFIKGKDKSFSVDLFTEQKERYRFNTIAMTPNDACRKIIIKAAEENIEVRCIAVYEGNASDAEGIRADLTYFPSQQTASNE